MKSFEKQFNQATCNIEVGAPKYQEIMPHLDKKEYQFEVLNKYWSDVCGLIISHYRQFPKLQVSGINNKDIPSQLDVKKIPFIEVDGEKQLVTGNTGCNNFDVKFLIRGNEVTMGNLATTKMACPNVLEVAFVEAFSQTISYQLTNNSLILTNNKGQTSHFVRMVK